MKYEPVNAFSEQRYEIVKSSANLCKGGPKKYPTPMPDITKKNKLAVWIAKDCTAIKGATKRLSIVEDLIINGLDVGGDSPCLQKNANKPQTFLSMTDFFEMISEHKFYLAFENSYHCKGYITEKFWLNSLYAGTVPVVYGAPKEDFIRLAPPRSFIHYDDFTTSRELIDYLQYLDRNDTAYMEYFHWRKLYPCDYPLHRVEDEEYKYATGTEFTFFYNTYCNLCKMLQTGTVRKKTIPSIYDHWYDGEHEDCLYGT